MQKRCAEGTSKYGLESFSIDILNMSWVRKLKKKFVGYARNKKQLYTVSKKCYKVLTCQYVKIFLLHIFYVVQYDIKWPNQNYIT